MQVTLQTGQGMKLKPDKQRYDTVAIVFEPYRVVAVTRATINW